MASLAVTFDTNPYRVLAHGKADSQIDSEMASLRERERRAGHTPFVNYWTAFELLVHLADPADPGYASCRQAVRALWRHCEQSVGGAELVPFAVDSEAQLAMMLFGYAAPDRQRQAEIYNHLLRRAAYSQDPADLADIQPALASLDAHCKAIEQRFVADMLKYAVRGLDPAATDWWPLKENKDLRRQALEYVRSGRGLTTIARTLVVKAANLAKVQLDVDTLEQKASIVLEHFRAPLEMYNAIVERILMSGADMSKANRANFIWDIQIAVLASESVELARMPLVLVTDDKPLLAAIERGGASSRAAKLDDYLNAI